MTPRISRAELQAELDAVADELNNRPRQTLNWKKPTEVLNKFLVEAG